MKDEWITVAKPATGTSKNNNMQNNNSTAAPRTNVGSKNAESRTGSNMATSGMTGGLTGRKDHSSGVRNGSSGGRSLPAFTIYEVSVQEISERLRLLLGQGSFTITMVGKSVISVRLRGLNDFEKVRLMLSERGYKFHTHTPTALLPYSVLVEGLSGDYTVEEVSR